MAHRDPADGAGAPGAIVGPLQHPQVDSRAANRQRCRRFIGKIENVSPFLGRITTSGSRFNCWSAERPPSVSWIGCQMKNMGGARQRICRTGSKWLMAYIRHALLAILFPLFPLESGSSSPSTESSRSPQHPDDAGTAGILLAGSSGVGAWSDSEMIAYALSARGPSSRSSSRNLWRASLRATPSGPVGGVQEVSHAYEARSCGKGGSERCLFGGDAELADAGQSLEEWGARLDAIVVVGLGRGGGKQEQLILCQASSVCTGIRRRGGICALLPAEGADLLGWELGGSDWEVWARSPSDELAVLSSLAPHSPEISPDNGQVGAGGASETSGRARRSGARVVAIPWSVPGAIARDSRATVPQLYAGILPVPFGTFDDGGSCGARALEDACSSAREVGGIRLVVASPSLNSGRAPPAVCDGVRVDIAFYTTLASLRRLYSAADFAIFPEPCLPDLAMHAMAALHAGLPVVGRDVVPLSEIVSPMHDGLLVPKGIARPLTPRAHVAS